MCGIAGIIALREELVRRALGPMVSCQAHRGPDDSGQTVVGLGPYTVGLGHRRLSILDLSMSGHQPMVLRGTQSCIVFNGEIYNYRALRRSLESIGVAFVGDSDTEVMLHALSRWGPNAVKRFEGMFAFAFYDSLRQHVMLARDPMGMKPLYTAVRDGALLFASELRAILATEMIPRKIDLRGASGVLAYGAVQEPFTIVSGVGMFPAGHYQLFDHDGLEATSTRLWSTPRPRPEMTELEATDRVRHTLDSAVQDHLAADVPVGLFLSSGLDSTIVAGLAARHSSRLRSFTVSFADHADMSEQKLSSETAELFGFDHTNIDISSPDAEAAAACWLQSLDQPSIDGLNIFVISRAVRAHGIIVALSGQGGDELFGGYPSFTDVPRLARLVHGLQLLPVGLRRSALSVASAGKSAAFRTKLADIGATNGGVLSLTLQRRRAMSDAQLCALGLVSRELGLDENFQAHETLADLEMTADDPIWNISQIESRFYQRNMLLRDADANGMAQGLEIRSPMLDRRVVELAFSMPSRVKLPHGRSDKHLLRVAFAKYLRPDVTTQAKRGFSLPIRRWMLGPLRDLCEEGLSSIRSAGFINRRGVDEVWSAFLKEPQTPIWSRAFALCVLGLYTSNLRLSA